MNNIILKMVSSLTKVFPDEIAGEEITYATAFQNEPFSYQIAFKSEEGDIAVTPLYTEVESNLELKYISEYFVGFVPVTKCSNVGDTDAYYDRKTEGLYPDMLLVRKSNAEIMNDTRKTDQYFEQDQEQQLYCVDESYQSLWFTINEKGESIAPGKYYITVSFYSTVKKEFLGKKTFTLEILPKELPKQDFSYTCWFHCDCLSDIYGVPVFSDRHFEIMRSYITEAAKTGMNLILLPAFTPPLDTPVGRERKTVQLVKVEYKGGDYKFDFSLMKRYIELCRECGINRFEHSHLFTQWGAQSAPKIVATVDGVEKRIFGWDTNAKDPEYERFLKSYFKGLLPFFKENNITNDQVFFHISDEPNEEFIDYYKNAQGILSDIIKEFSSGDALSHYKYYENGSVKLPIVRVSSDDIEKFKENCDNYWVYYTGNQLHYGYSNRLITTTASRNRKIGVEAYAMGAKGFLHWGYNYYYGVLSHGLFNPTYYPGGYGQNPGSSFIIYPKSDGTAIPSMRMKVFYEGINDYRALQLYETLTSKETVLDFIRKYFGEPSFKFIPDNKKLFDFRQDLNRIIKATLIQT